MTSCPCAQFESSRPWPATSSFFINLSNVIALTTKPWRPRCLSFRLCMVDAASATNFDAPRPAMTAGYIRASMYFPRGNQIKKSATIFTLYQLLHSIRYCGRTWFRFPIKFWYKNAHGKVPRYTVSNAWPLKFEQAAVGSRILLKRHCHRLTYYEFQKVTTL
jgi:hypothetical protein